MTRRAFAQSFAAFLQACLMNLGAQETPSGAVPDTAIEYLEPADKSSFRLRIKSALKCDLIRVVILYDAGLRSTSGLPMLSRAEGLAPWIAPDVLTEVNPGFLFPRSKVRAIELTFLANRAVRNPKP